MNITNRLREQATGRWVVVGVAAALAGFTLGGAAGALTAIAAVAVTPVIISLVAYFWTRSAEWAKLGVAEDYGTQAMKVMEAQQRSDLRASLDTIGQEALDEVEAAIARRDEEAE